MDFHPLPVERVDRLCEDAVAVTFAVPDRLRPAYAFRPGQYLTLRRPAAGDAPEVRRQYSICAPAGAAPRVGVRRVDGGAWSSWLVDRCVPGDEIEVAPPAGTFGPAPGAGGHHGLIGAGSGITPLLSIASSLLGDRPDTRVTLVYGNRRTDTVMFTEDLADLKDRYGPRLHLLHVLSQEPTGAELLHGRLSTPRLQALLDGGPVATATIGQWWLCGPLGVTDGAAEVLGALGVERGRIHRELFYVDQPPPAPERRTPGATVATVAGRIVLNGRSTDLDLPVDTPVLDAGQAVRGDLPFACKGGVCGTCRARVIAGEVAMRRNFALEDDELDAGFVLTCQSLPVPDAGRLVVDYDQ